MANLISIDIADIDHNLRADMDEVLERYLTDDMRP